MSQRVNADGFSAFLTDQRNKIAAAFKEIEELQKLYQGSYTRFRTDHDKTLLALVTQIEKQSDGLSAALNPQVKDQQPVEKQGIVKRIAELEKTTVPDLQKQADQLLASAQKQAADLRAANPKLNDLEEKLKAQLASRKKQLDDLNGKVQKLASGLGFVFNVGKIHQLDRDRFKLIGQMEALDKQLAKVRQDWKELRDKTAKEELEWRAQWQTAMTQLGQLRQEHDYLAQNIDDQAHHRATVFVIDNMKALPNGTSDASLKQMVTLNIQTDAFQAVLGSVAGILGVLKGVDEGLTRIGESVAALIAEQKRNSAYLPALELELADGVVAFGKTWDDLIAKSKDEKALATQPADFVAAMKPFLDERLTKDHIAGFFDALGDALTRATKGWKGK